MKPLREHAAPAASSKGLRIGDRFRDATRPGREFELAAVIRPRSGIPHVRLRDVERWRDARLLSLRALENETCYRPIRRSAEDAPAPSATAGEEAAEDEGRAAARPEQPVNNRREVHA